MTDRDPPLLLYLHGFASSPGGTKATRFRAAFAERGGARFVAPDLNRDLDGAEDFEGLTLSRQLASLERLTAAEPPGSVLLIGSSLGGYAAALFAEKSAKIRAAMLMAPAFDFCRRWAEKLGPAEVARWRELGSLPIHHYGYERTAPIGYGLLEDAERHPAFPNVTVPTLVVHGRNDDTVDPQVSIDFARDRDNVRLELVDSDHLLGDAVDWLLEQTLAFFAPWLGAPRGEPGSPPPGSSGLDLRAR